MESLDQLLKLKDDLHIPIRSAIMTAMVIALEICLMSWSGHLTSRVFSLFLEITSTYVPVYVILDIRSS